MTRSADGAPIARWSVTMLRTSLIALCLSSLLVPACASQDAGDAEDGLNDAATGKADSPISEGGADARLVLGLVNDGGVSDAELDNEAGLSTRVAEAIVKYRDGADREFGTDDDKPFKTLAELDAIPYLGPAAMSALLAYAKHTGTATTLTIELVAREWHDGPDVWGTVKLSDLNTELAADHVSFPKTLTLGPRDGAKFLKVLHDIETANQKLGREIELDHTWDPSEYVGLCYTGDIRGVPRVVEGLRESMFSIYMGIQGERWGTTKRFHYNGAGEGSTEAAWIESQNEENADTMKVWTSFDTSSTSYLMMTDGGQQGDGTEFFATTIKKCR
jgi:hypothetical protein